MYKNEFIKLGTERKMEILWDHGEPLFERAYYDYNICLFLLGNFYVEVFFDRVKNEIASVSVQENDQILFGYVKDLGLSELAVFLE